eukprot:1745102-Pyramimonas_sp.AAC.1
MIERLNSLCTARHPVRAPGRNSVDAGREHFLDQLSAVHQKNGGDDPVSSSLVSSLRLGSTEKNDTASYLPLLD